MANSITNNIKASPAAVKARQGALIKYMLKFQSSTLSNLQDMLYSSVDTSTSGASSLFAQPPAATTAKKATATSTSLKQSLNVKA